MKRFALVGAAAVATVIASAIPVFADTADNLGLVQVVTKTVERTVDPVLNNVPSPPGWEQRHVCAWNDHINQSWCVYFPFPV